MADDLSKTIRQIAQMLGMPSNPTSTTDSAEVGSAPLQPDPPAQSFQPQNMGALSNNIDILSKAREMMDSFNNVSDSRINLLHSIHPFLSSTRQSSCSSCIQLLKIISVISSISPGNRSSGSKG